MNDMASEIIPQESLENTFGSNVFNEAVMRTRLPKATFKALKKTIDEGLPLDPAVADIVANAMKDWAIEKGATHFTHWFQPMTGITAEKHDSFISPTSDGKIISGIFRQRINQRRTGCIVLPFRRIAFDIRSARLYGMGLHFACIL